jgi:hypothetical protein
MSKEAALRAMREARYNARATGSTATSTAARPAVRPAQSQASAPVAPADQSDAEPCGHRSMNGRTCTREQGHAAKNHRYS